ncbi:MAG: alpha/beta fold hydrolase, partial [Solirubrobacteraceae bacterium]
TFGKLVISGGHSPVFETICDVLAERLTAWRETVAGRGHTIPATGAPYNALLEEFLSGADG